ncbi:Fatty acyl-CoA reductase 1 [Camponotus floridanus]|uniref:Fatty acyl-CoA reductase n=1 Tax=Camponotus floridanus TaxID=104421 RepID=E2ALZ3_CAMFO|nr:Fatty acyl-CoA reductase 1 [Camponotus floridanus]
MGITDTQTNSGHAHNETHSIDTFFAETEIFIIGATGFLGKALLEKLLRSCHCVATIFVLIRPKRNQSIEERFRKLLENPIFDRIRTECPSVLNKIFPVKGDLGMPELGLQLKDKEMLIQRVNIVFHIAATVRFNEPLKIAVNINTRATDRMLDLCRHMTNLISVIYVSTAYSNADRREIKESIYTTKIKPYTVIDMCENLDDETMKIIEKTLIGNHPNTYTLTKGLAEQIVLSKGIGLPIAIVRPSIICAAYQEPFPGWIDNVNGVTGLMTETSRGTVRSLIGNANLVVDIIPLDFVVNTLICASWHNAVQRSDTVKIYNCTSSSLHPITSSEFVYLAHKYAIKFPSKYVMWYPNCTLRTNRFIHTIIVVMLHFLPAFILDLILRIQGCKPIMMKIAKRFDRGAKSTEFFRTKEWKFYADNMMKLIKFVRASGNCNDFSVDIRNLDWDAYLHHYMLGIRKYILQDNPDTLNNSRKRLSRLYWIDKLTKIVLLVMILFVFWRYISII